MNFPDYYGYGQLFAFSGIDGENSHDEDFAGMLMPGKISIRFDAPDAVTLSVPCEIEKFDAVFSDVITGGEVKIVFYDKNTVLGFFENEISIFSEKNAPVKATGNARILSADGFCYCLLTSGRRFAFCREKSEETALAASEEKINADIDAICEKRLDYYRKMPACDYSEFEKLYYKCLSINKVNVYSPQGGIDCRSTTPDRLPHRHIWLWDSMFHAMAIADYDAALAKDSIRAVLQCQREDGFIPHMIKSREDISDITQPQVIALAALSVYKKDGDKSFLAYSADKIAAFLLWFTENRDLNKNGLFEWKTDFANTRCRCDESGMDNSPRFDTTETLDAIDCSCFMANDCRCLAEIYSILGESEKSEKFRLLADETAEKINSLLWDENAGAYTDREFSGKLTGALTCSSFLPLFAGICDNERAEKLVSLLLDKEKFASEMPVPSIARDNEFYGADMWRGCTWLNYNYFIISGLKRYGYTELADSLARTTLEKVNKWFELTGNVFEFYDAEDKTAPWHLNRKGPQPEAPDYRKKYHAITDYNWSASFILMLLRGEY